ncbi:MULTISPECIES: CapA family protein [unclassified Streptomyces]|uniref:CapA family protein n=1 Tax=unclassified Streptomyces TaxID=2593676 RepID=UPI003369FE70
MAVSLFAVGDVFIDRENPETAFDVARDLLSTGDVVFGNCEGVFSDTWERAPSSGSPVVAPAKNAAPLAGAGFHVMSLANNHSVDGGHQALLNTRDTLNDLGISTVGAGANIAEARTPAIVERDGVRIAFLAYSSVFPHGYEARAGVPGLAPLRAHTRYTPWELNEWNPGLLPRVSTENFPEDVEAFIRDVRAVRDQADIVAISFHWGDFTRPFVLTDNERRLARLAVDSGADIVLGHHHHMLRGIEWYEGKPIFYGLGHYVFDLPNLPQRLAKDGYLSAARPQDEIELSRRFGEFRISPKEEYPLLPFHPDARMTGVAVVRVGSEGVLSAGFCPALIDAGNEPVPVAPESATGRRIVEYLTECCSQERLPTRFTAPLDGSGLPAGSIQALPVSESGIGEQA